MTREDIYAKLNEVFRDTFDDESITVSDETTSADIEGWDSLMHISLIVNTEQSFNIKFSMGEVSVMKNVKDLVDAISSKIS